MRASQQGAIPEVFADVLDREKFEAFIDLHEPKSIIHMAAQSLVLPAYNNPFSTFETNVMGTATVLDVAFKKRFIKSIIVVTTDKVYRNNNSRLKFTETDPLEGKDPYSASKVGAESVVSAWQQISKVSGGPLITSVRAGNVIGGGDFAQNRLMPDIIRATFFGKELVIRNPDSTRPWQHVLDPLVGYLMALDAISAGTEIKTLNFSHNESQNLSVNEVLKVASRFGQIDAFHNLSAQATTSNEKIKEAAHLSLDSDLALKTIEWRPTWSQNRAIEETMNWWQKVIEEGVNPIQACEKTITDFFGQI